MDKHLPVLPNRRDCTSCSLHEGARSVGIGLHLAQTPAPDLASHTLLCVGQNPGWEEDRTGIPFIGPSGRLLFDVYLAGIQASRFATIYLTNTARCIHPPSTAGPKASHFKACRSYLLTDLTVLSTPTPTPTTGGEPQIHVLLLGAAAATHTYAALGRPKMTLSTALDAQATRLPIPGTSVTAVLFATYHPAAVLRTHNLIHAVQGHMQVLLDHLQDQIRTPTTPSFIRPRPPIPVPRDHP